MIRPQLLICGYGVAGKAVAKAFENRGLPRNTIVFVERSRQKADSARGRRFLSVSGDATDVARLRVAGAAIAAEIVICVGDEKAAAVAVAVKNAAAQASVSAVVDHPSVKADVLSAGARSVLVLSEIAGQLLAESAFLPRLETRLG